MEIPSSTRPVTYILQVAWKQVGNVLGSGLISFQRIRDEYASSQSFRISCRGVFNLILFKDQLTLLNLRLNCQLLEPLLWTHYISVEPLRYLTILQITGTFPLGFAFIYPFSRPINMGCKGQLTFITPPNLKAGKDKVIIFWFVNSRKGCYPLYHRD